VLGDVSAFEELVARATADPDVLGIVLTGSRARDGMATEHSDADVYVIVEGYSAAWDKTKRTPELDEVPLSREDLADTTDRGHRYSFRGAKVLLDRLDGGIQELVNKQATLSEAEIGPLVRDELDGYINLIYRGAKNRRDGREDLARLEDMESVSWFLRTLFAIFGRVRPYNKYLRWELETYPLPAPWTADYVIKTATDNPLALFRDLEPLVRARGFGDVVDDWGTEIELVR
jgi:predicted nucleotidyltransferase